jgi:hypothetical protein
MARDGSGNFTNPYPDFVSGTVISSTQVDSNNSDIATALTQSIAVDGQSVVTANLPMATKKFTGLGAGSAATDSANLGQVQAQAYIWGASAGGAADALTISTSPAITAYAAGQMFRLVASANNTGAATIAVSGLAAKAIQRNGAALAAADIVSGKIYELLYDGTQFQLSGSYATIPVSGGGTGATSASAARTALGLAIGSDVQAFSSNIVQKNVQNTFTKAQVPSTYTAALSATSGVLDYDTYTNFIVTLAAGANTLAAPTTEGSQVGQCGVIIFIQPSSGAAATVSLHADYETAAAAGLVVSSANNDYDIVPYMIKADNSVLLGAAQLNFG